MPVFSDRADWNLPTVLAAAAQRFPDRRFLRFGFDGQELTYSAAYRGAAAVAGGLRQLGLARGENLLIMLDNRAEFALSWFGAGLLGAVEVPVNVDYSGEFLEHLANSSRASLMVVEARLLPVLRASVERLTHLRGLVVVGKGDLEVRGLAVTAFDELVSAAPAPPLVVSSAELAAIHFTSGTTGRSKGAMMTHAHQHLIAEQNRELVRLGAEDVFLTHLPLFHVNAQATAVYAAMLVGAEVCVWPRFSASAWLDELRATGATVTTALGGMLQYVLAQPPRAEDLANRLRAVWAVPAPVEACRELSRRFGVERVATVYGNTEVGTVTDPRLDDLPPGSCGRPDERWFELRILDPETDEEVPTGEAGEVAVRPRVPWVVTQGYVGQPERTAEAFRNLWFHTGDSLRQDADGYLYFVDRIKDRIRVRGENVASADVEFVLNQHPAVTDSAVVAVPSEVRVDEDELKACVVLEAGSSLDAQQLLQWCEERLPAFAVPRYLELFAELPKTPTAKVRKDLLRAAGVTEATYDRGPRRQRRAVAEGDRL